MTVHKRTKRRKITSRVKAEWRDTLILLREFRWPLLAFLLLITGGGTLYHFLSKAAGEPTTNLIASMYHLLGLTFLQPLEPFPRKWYLEIFWFAAPLLGLGILAQGITEFSVMLFNRRTRGKEWQVAVASTFNQHVILVGLGHLGYRVAVNLTQMDQDVVVIETAPRLELASALQGLDIPLIHEDATHENALENAGIRKARSIILCTQNDSLNLQVALKARSINPAVNVIVRIFDVEFAQALQQQFGFQAVSATGLAAPAFAAAATGIDMTPPLTVGGKALSLARVKVTGGSVLAGKRVEEIEQHYNLSVVLLDRDHSSDLHPAGDRCLESGDTLAVLSGPTEIGLLMQDNQPAS
jgi:Trk K+ transport system NAD-binding subunit